MKKSEVKFMSFICAVWLLMIFNYDSMAVMKHPEKWKELINKEPCVYRAINLPRSPDYNDILKWALLWENETWNHIWVNDPISPVKLNKPAVGGGEPYWPAIVNMKATERQLKLFGDMIERLKTKGLEVREENEQLDLYLKVYKQSTGFADDANDVSQLYMAVRLAKRHLMLRDPDLAVLTKLLFVKRFPFEPTHNYTDISDNNWDGGGSICVLDIPRIDGRIKPDDAKVTVLFHTPDGFPRDPICDYDAEYIYFANRGPGVTEQNHWHLMRMKPDGTELKQLTEGQSNDYYPCPLPNGDVTFVSTRIKCRFLCAWAMVLTLYRMNADGGDMRALSYANLTEWAPSIMKDGRILWTRSEYQDKGANFGHTLWAVRPDGTYPELIYGNDTINCVVNGHEVPGSNEYVGTMISHYGDLNGPIALIDPEQGRFNPDAVTNITPDVGYGYDGRWHTVGNEIAIYPERRCFRDPYPISRDYFLVSHSPAGDWNSPTHLFGLYVIDRYGNRELLYIDPNIGSMAPTPLRKRQKAPILASLLKEQIDAKQAFESGDEHTGEFILSDVYQGLPTKVKPGSIKYLRIVEELKSNVITQPDGRIRESYFDFLMRYASPIFKFMEPFTAQIYDVRDPNGRWPTYVVKSVEGIVPVEDDGSARFTVPAGKVLYFQALDEDYNEIQRMRSIIQLQANENRSCIGCHELRDKAPANKTIKAMAKAAESPQPPPWGKGPFDYQKVIQPIFNKNCVSCHAMDAESGIDLRGVCDANKVPESYRTLITKGLVDYFDMGWGQPHTKTEAMTFGSLKSKLIKLLSEGHQDIKLTRDEMHAVKCWIDLNCPLWPDYQYRGDRACAIEKTTDKDRKLSEK
jgi:hypothetical protein